MTTMRAAVYRRYGPPQVVGVEDVPKPVPGPGELLIRIRATSVTSADWRMRSLEVPAGFGVVMRLVCGIRGPRKTILGTVCAGDVEAIGSGVTRFSVGDAVFAYPGSGLGCHAEYRTIGENGVVAPKPDRCDYQDAAAIPFGGVTALRYLRDMGKVRSGEKVLVIGASGAVGSAAVQLARHFGCEVTGVTSTANLELVRGLGVDAVIDYTQGDYLRDPARWDVIFDTVGVAPVPAARKALTPRGRLLLAVAGFPEMAQAAWYSITSPRKVLAGDAKARREDLSTLAELVEAGEFRPVIDSVFPLERIVEAHARVDSRRKTGSVVVTP